MSGILALKENSEYIAVTPKRYTFKFGVSWLFLIIAPYKYSYLRTYLLTYDAVGDGDVQLDDPC